MEDKQALLDEYIKLYQKIGDKISADICSKKIDESNAAEALKRLKESFNWINNAILEHPVIHANESVN